MPVYTSLEQLQQDNAAEHRAIVQAEAAQRRERAQPAATIVPEKTPAWKEHLDYAVAPFDAEIRRLEWEQSPAGQHYQQQIAAVVEQVNAQLAALDREAAQVRATGEQRIAQLEREKKAAFVRSPRPL